MELLSFGQFYGRYVDSVINDDISGRAELAQVITMAQEAGLVTINGNDVDLTYDKRSKDFKVELGGTSPVVVVPRGVFPELNNYAAADGIGGDMLRYAD